MNLCYYCEEKAATAIRNSEPACDHCYNADVRMILDPSKTKNETDKDRAQRLKIMLRMFKHDKKEETFIKECTDPTALMDWLEKVSEDIICKGSFKVEYEKFLKQWKELFGSTDDIPQEFKERVNSRYKTMIKI